MSGRQRPVSYNDPHDSNDYFTTSLRQRQHQVRTHLRIDPLSRPSSSSGSAAHTLRRVPGFEDALRPRRSASLDSLTRPFDHSTKDPSRFPSSTAGRRRSVSHSALRISRRTASAILYTLEEALRTPYPFTSDLVEEKAPMSGIGGGSNARASNGGARTTGPAPVVQPSTSGGLRTPRDIMKDREAREARRRAEAEQAKRQQEEDRRRSAERRSLASGNQAATRDSGGSQRRSTGSAGPQPGERESFGGKTPLRGSDPHDTPQAGARLSREAQGDDATSQARPLGAQPATTARRTQPITSGLRQSSAPASTTPAAAAASSHPVRDGLSDGRRENASSFPHAFERWEQLSSHWEGLTGYWLHKLESNQEEIARTNPSASAMSRQITDLSAAGANLFHAVVELQRLRASSERKFQRWFFETKAEQERAQESQADLEKMLQVERDARNEATTERARAEQAKRNAEKMVGEMRRELNISKEEARRAWEELGRREQEERDRTTSLREGMPTVVGGVQVVPMHASAGLSRQGSESQRPSTRDDTHYQSSRGATRSRQEPYADQSEQGYYEEGASPTDTDPFTQGGQPAAVLHHEPNVQSLASGSYQPYPLGSTPATSGSTALTAIPPSQQPRTLPTAGPRQPVRTAPPVPPKDDEPLGPQPPSSSAQDPTMGSMAPQERTIFYQHPPGQTFLHSPASAEAPNLPTQQPTSALPHHHQPPTDLRSEPSYISSATSTDETEYEIDNEGNLRRDAQGRPLVYRHAGEAQPASSDRHRHRRRTSDAMRSEESDDYDIEADIAREREHAVRYGVSPQRTVATSSAEAPGHRGYSAETGAVAGVAEGETPPLGAGAGYTYIAPGMSGSSGSGGSSSIGGGSGGGGGILGTGIGVGPDYEAQAEAGYGGWEQAVGLTRHHHPTRLSDVMEEEDEGRSRTSRTSRG